MKTFAFLKSACLLLLALLTAAQCQAAPLPTPTPPPVPPTPTPLLIAPIPTGDGSDLLDRLLQNGVLRVGIRVWPEPNFSPPAFRSFGGALSGFEVDVAHQIADGLGLELELVEAYPPVIATGDWRGQWDIAIASLVPFDQPPDPSTQPLVFSQPYGYMPMGLLSLATTSDIKALGSIAGREVGVLEHSTYERLLLPAGSALTVQQKPLLSKLPAEVKPVPLANLQKAIRQMGQSETDAEFRGEVLFGPGPIFQEAVKSDLPLKWVKVGVQPLAIAAVPVDNLKVDRLMLEINKILARLHRQGTLSEIYLKWYEQDFSQPEAGK